MNKELSNKLLSELLWAYTRSGALQRASIYEEQNKQEEAKATFRRSTKEYLFRHVYLKYKGKKLTEFQLQKSIDGLVQLHDGASCLKENQLRYGNAQKFVNLYLKGMWVAGLLKAAPPHFPVDSIIIKALRQKGNWTNMNRNEYLVIIKAAQDNIKKSKYKNIAEWEAAYYQGNFVDKKGA
jgi:hypothetical protein